MQSNTSFKHGAKKCAEYKTAFKLKTSDSSMQFVFRTKDLNLKENCGAD
jgi:hypothetical protein